MDPSSEKCQKMREYTRKKSLSFEEAYEILQEWADWLVIESQKKEPAYWTRFCHLIGCASGPLRRKIQAHEELEDLFEYVMELSETELVEGALKGRYHAQVWARVVEKQFDWENKKSVAVSGTLSEINSIIENKEDLVDANRGSDLGEHEGSNVEANQPL